MKKALIAVSLLLASANTLGVELTLKMGEISDFDVRKIMDSNPFPDQKVWLDEIGRWTKICPRESVEECTDALYKDMYNPNVNTGYAISNSCGTWNCVVYLITYGFK